MQGHSLSARYHLSLIQHPGFFLSLASAYSSSFLSCAHPYRQCCGAKRQTKEGHWGTKTSQNPWDWSANVVSLPSYFLFRSLSVPHYIISRSFDTMAFLYLRPRSVRYSSLLPRAPRHRRRCGARRPMKESQGSTTDIQEGLIYM